MIVLPGEKEGLQFTISSESQGEVNFPLKYKINDIHEFKVAIIADIIAVTLKPQTDELKFIFRNDRTNKSEMFITQKVEYENKGNKEAEFSWQTPSSKFFKIDPIVGKVEPGTKKAIFFTFEPVGTRIKGQIIEDLKMSLTYGTSLKLRVIGNVSECECELPTSSIEFGEVHIGEPKTLDFSIKNKLSSIVAYEIVTF